MPGKQDTKFLQTLARNIVSAKLGVVLAVSMDELGRVSENHDGAHAHLRRMAKPLPRLHASGPYHREGFPPSNARNVNIYVGRNRYFQGLTDPVTTAHQAQLSVLWMIGAESHAGREGDATLGEQGIGAIIQLEIAGAERARWRQFPPGKHVQAHLQNALDLGGRQVREGIARRAMLHPIAPLFVQKGGPAGVDVQLYIVAASMDFSCNGAHGLVAEKTGIERLDKKYPSEAVCVERIKDEVQAGIIFANPAFNTSRTYWLSGQRVRKCAPDGEFDVNRDGNLNTHNSVLAEAQPCALSHISS